MPKKRLGVKNVTIYNATHKRLEDGKKRVAEYKLVHTQWPLVTDVTFDDVIKVAIDLFEERYPPSSMRCPYESCDGTCSERIDSEGRHLPCIGHNICPIYKGMCP